MTRWLFTPTGLTGSTIYRIDLFPGWASPTTITPSEGGGTVVNSLITSDSGGSLDPFSHTTAGTLYAKPVNSAGAEIGVPVVLTGSEEGAITLADLASDVTDLLGASHATAYPAAEGIRAAVRRNLPATILTIGDSTGDATTEQFYLLGSKIGEAHPDYSVNYRLWGPDGSTEAWGPVIPIQTGPGGQRGIKPASGNPLYFTNANTYTGDFGYRAHISPSDGWAPGGAAAVRNIVSRGVDSSSNRHSKFGLDETGKLVWEWSAAGTSYATAVVSTVACPFEDDEWGWVRVDFDVDNGASGNTATFYTSTDGWTWTQLGDPVVTATATSLSSSTQRFHLGEYGSVAGTRYSNMYYAWVDVRNNTLSSGTWQQVASTQPESWDYTHTGTLPTITGSPVIWVLNCSRSGQGISFFSDSNRRVKIHAENNQKLVILNDGHNEQYVNGNEWRTAYGGWIDDIRNRSKYVPIVCLCQNPGFIADGELTLEQLDATVNARRAADIATMAAGSPGCFSVDYRDLFTQSALEDDLPDNLHPSASAQERMAQHLYDALFA